VPKATRVLRLPLRPHQRLGLLLALLLVYPWSCGVYELGCVVVDSVTEREAMAVLARIQPGWTPEQVAHAVGYPPDAGGYYGHPGSDETVDNWPVGGRRIEVHYWRGHASTWHVVGAPTGPIRSRLDVFYYFWAPD
jgi:hypothetical protein